MSPPLFFFQLHFCLVNSLMKTAVVLADDRVDGVDRDGETAVCIPLIVNQLPKLEQTYRSHLLIIQLA